jgi:hypothetical protein
MFYLPPNEFWYLTVARLELTFDDNRRGLGTGFFVLEKGRYFLVTARHVVDQRYLPGHKKRDSKPTSLRFSFQSAVNPGTEAAAVGYQKFEVTNPEFRFEEDDVDLSLIDIPPDVLPLVTDDTTTRPCSFAYSFLANEEELASRYAGEPVVFIGFPEDSPVNRVGADEFHYPLLRQGVLAYPPTHGLEVAGELGKDYGIIDSFAQAGFSGGPVVVLQKGWSDGSWHPVEDYRASRVIGIVCGHYKSRQDGNDGVHAGLSFFARSTSIRRLVSSCFQ